MFNAANLRLRSIATPSSTRAGTPCRLGVSMAAPSRQPHLGFNLMWVMEAVMSWTLEPKMTTKA